MGIAPRKEVLASSSHAGQESDKKCGAVPVKLNFFSNYCTRKEALVQWCSRHPVIRKYIKVISNLKEFLSRYRFS